MENYNFHLVEKKWQSFFENSSIFLTKKEKKKKNFIVLKCFLIHQEIFTWVT